jgi:putative endonuclease
LRCGDGTLYTGIATDVTRRLAEHSSATGRGAKYLRGRQPLELLLTRAVESRELAQRVEHRIKQLPRARKAEIATTTALLDHLVDAETERLTAATRTKSS